MIHRFSDPRIEVRYIHCNASNRLRCMCAIEIQRRGKILSNTGSLIPTATHEYCACEKRSEVQITINNQLRQLYITHQIKIICIYCIGIKLKII